MAPLPSIYCIDTSSIFEWYIRTYPPSILPKLPERIEGLIVAGRMRAPKAVLDEIKAGDDCHTWAKGQTDLFVEESTGVQQRVRKLMAEHHNPAKPLKGINGADPFVIALAQVERCCVVTQETFAPRKIKIPDVCAALSIECIDVLELMRREKWKFG